MNIFFCSALGARWASGWQRCQSLHELGYEITEFNLDEYSDRRLGARLLLRFQRGTFNTVFLGKFNSDFLERITSAKPDIAWVEKALMLCPETLSEAKKRLPGCTFVCFQDDDPFGLRDSKRQFWKYFKEAIPFYDLHFVKKEVDLGEFKDNGALNVALFTSGFYPGIFCPQDETTLSEKYRKDVVFVGSPLDHRVHVIGDLIRQWKIPVNVYGNLWDRKLIFYSNRRLFHPAIVEEAYVNLICGAKISLGFVSSSNRDEYSMRTFEIPSCKGFFLAQRTLKHQEFYVEGSEAEFFGSTEECADKVRFYLSNDAARRRIAEGGYRRCMNDDYSLHRRMRDALAVVRVCQRQQ